MRSVRRVAIRAIAVIQLLAASFALYLAMRGFHAFATDASERGAFGFVVFTLLAPLAISLALAALSLLRGWGVRILCQFFPALVILGIVAFMYWAR